MKNFIIRIFATLALFQSFIFAEPSKTETISFIKQKLYKYGKIIEYTNGIKQSTTTPVDISINSNCQFIYPTYTEHTGAGTSKGLAFNYKHTMTVSLTKLNPSKMDTSVSDLGTIRLNFQCREDKECIDTKNPKKGGGHYKEARVWDSIDIKSKEQSDKLVKAFSHLIQLCGGKDELF